MRVLLVCLILVSCSSIRSDREVAQAQVVRRGLRAILDSAPSLQNGALAYAKSTSAGSSVTELKQVFENAKLSDLVELNLLAKAMKGKLSDAFKKIVLENSKFSKSMSALTNGQIARSKAANQKYFLGRAGNLDSSYEAVFSSILSKVKSSEDSVKRGLASFQRDILPTIKTFYRTASDKIKRSIEILHIKSLELMQVSEGKVLVGKRLCEHVVNKIDSVGEITGRMTEIFRKNKSESLTMTEAYDIAYVDVIYGKKISVPEYRTAITEGVDPETPLGYAKTARNELSEMKGPCAQTFSKLN